MKENELLTKELKGCFDYFNQEWNSDISSKGYGLVKDKAHSDPLMSSISATGFGLCSMVIGVKRNWIDYQKAFDRVNKTLDTFLDMENFNGFYYHFVDINTTQRYLKSEVSVIDTAILIAGMIVCGEFFGGRIKQKADNLYKRVNWNWYTDNQKKMYYMCYTKENGFTGYWDWYGEQLMLYVMGVSSPTYPIECELYEKINKIPKSYNNIKDIYYAYFGALFTYQFSHSFIDFKNLRDKNGIDWFKNSVKATKANRVFCIKNSKKYLSYNKNSWGLTPCLSPKGYLSFGASPSHFEPEHDGTITPCGAIGSIVFTPKESIKAMEYFNSLKNLQGKYGYKDAFNLDQNWFADDYIGIDKGISMLMIENYLSQTIWQNFHKNQYIKKGIDMLFEKY
ncbi:MAG: hypothetical protein IJW82_06765 [Clostridia bacterium]|nr:hypothetical protein [Clostridia bacterium]